ncbi:helix-turn-helix transcriptional regulator [Micromonospora zhanjiangensis]|uniref:Helix-turn-helix transcriptional regulator n=1 Tax=Micromonospora zhanjiangensis TaxID=1522057 RepID=A0ABV8KT06_9ACTN
MALKRYRLSQRRKALGYSQERFAERLGVDRSTVTRWESAETDPQPWHRTTIAAALSVSLDQLDEILSDVSVATRRGHLMGDDTERPPSVATRTELLTPLRSFLNTHLSVTSSKTMARTPVEVRRSVGRVHGLYQRASYSSAARLVPDVLREATELSGKSSATHRDSAFKLLAAAYIAASKLACKIGDGDAALLTADRASTAARLAEDRALTAVAAYQAACALLRLPSRAAEAAQVTNSSIEQLARDRQSIDPDLLSAQGSLLLLAAIIAARQGLAREACLRLTEAQRLAEQLGSDRNRLWTAFGPTNVVIHTLSAAVQRGNPDQALDIATRVDTSRLPSALVGRRAQVHLDLAAATAMTADGGSLAVLHLLEAERIAPETVYANVQARSLLLDLMGKERRTVTPGLRPLAARAGLLA